MRIGVFDSGLGGLTTLIACLRYLPDAHYGFYADSQNAPYGDKSPAEIASWTARARDYFVDWGADAMVIACNTATSAAAAPLRAVGGLPIIGIEPAIKQALGQGTGDILLLATELTVRGGKLAQLLAALPEAQQRVQALACPGWMDIIEGQTPDWQDQAFAYWQERIAPWVTLGTEAVVLGCTHYCWLEKEIAAWLGPGRRVLHGNDGVARQLYRQLLAQEPPAPSPLPKALRLDLNVTGPGAQATQARCLGLLAAAGLEVRQR